MTIAVSCVSTGNVDWVMQESVLHPAWQIRNLTCAPFYSQASELQINMVRPDVPDMVKDWFVLIRSSRILYRGKLASDWL
jgi:hypothetical protein